MSTETTATNPVNELVAFAQSAKELPAEKVPAWLILGRGKLVLDQGLTKYSLELSGILNGYEKYTKLTVAELTKKLADFRKRQGDMVEFRKLYTKHLDALVIKCMAQEKAYNHDPKKGDVNETYKLAAALELNLRKEAEEDEIKKQKKATENANLTAHIKNEYYRIAAQYRKDLEVIINDAYTHCLTQKTPVENIHIATDAAKKTMKDVRPQQRTAFTLVLTTKEEAEAILKDIPTPDYATAWAEALSNLKEKFELYANDLENAPAAIEAANEELADTISEINNDVEATAATTVLLENAGAYVAPPAGLKAVEVKKKIKIQKEDQRWVTAIMAAFLNNFVKCIVKIRNSDYSKITIAQMAAALDAAEVKVLNVEYETIEK